MNEDIEAAIAAYAAKKRESRKKAIKPAENRPRKKRDDSIHRYLHLKLNRKKDADVIAWIEKQDSMTGAIRSLIRAQIRADEDK